MQHLSSKAGAFLLLLGLTACGGGGGSVPNISQSAEPALSSVQRPAQSEPESIARLSTGIAAISTSAQGTDVIEIDAGSKVAVGAWVADTDYSGGAIATVSNAIKTANVSDPAPQSVYQTQRYAGTLTYTVPKLTAQSAYTVRLHFAETFWTAAKKRLFNVTINGTQVLANFDIFATAGGPNTATIQQFTTKADSTGKITIQFAATLDNASIAGIEIVTGSSSTPTSAPATPAPSPLPPTTGDELPWVYSELWSGSSPFRTTVAQQKSQGAQVVSHSYMDSLWSQGIAGNGTAQSIPIYVSKSSDPLMTAVCTQYGGGCNASNVQIHVPTNATAQQSSDGHLTLIDQSAPSGQIEIDCWQTVKSGSRLECSWAGLYKLGSSGVSENGSEAIHGGMAVASVYTAGQEFANGHIDHALGMATNCLNNSPLYPADTTNGTDRSCGGSTPPHYGNLMHLLWSASQISSSAYSAPCKVILTALATYGAYLNDTGNNGLQIDTQNELSYTASSATSADDPWPHIQSELNSAGDGNGESWHSCLNRLSSSDFELIQIAQP